MLLAGLRLQSACKSPVNTCKTSKLFSRMCRPCMLSRSSDTSYMGNWQGAETCSEVLPSLDSASSSFINEGSTMACAVNGHVVLPQCSLT